MIKPYREYMHATLLVLVVFAVFISWLCRE